MALRQTGRPQTLSAPCLNSTSDEADTIAKNFFFPFQLLSGNSLQIYHNTSLRPFSRGSFRGGVSTPAARRG
jgi:hypothetical protein